MFFLKGLKSFYSDKFSNFFITKIDALPTSADFSIFPPHPAQLFILSPPLLPTNCFSYFSSRKTFSPLDTFLFIVGLGFTLHIH